eukprot:8660945-Pyramimonas_sp.AAC.1
MRCRQARGQRDKARSGANTPGAGSEGPGLIRHVDQRRVAEAWNHSRIRRPRKMHSSYVPGAKRTEAKLRLRATQDCKRAP